MHFIKHFNFTFIELNFIKSICVSLIMHQACCIYIWFKHLTIQWQQSLAKRYTLVLLGHATDYFRPQAINLPHSALSCITLKIRLKQNGISPSLCFSIYFLSLFTTQLSHAELHKTRQKKQKKKHRVAWLMIQKCQMIWDQNLCCGPISVVYIQTNPRGGGLSLWLQLHTKNKRGAWDTD